MLLLETTANSNQNWTVGGKQQMVLAVEPSQAQALSGDGENVTFSWNREQGKQLGPKVTCFPLFFLLTVSTIVL